jgi:Txe/YoeB family toxin of Txe-Axe toxin-antitoxin module
MPKNVQLNIRTTEELKAEIEYFQKKNSDKFKSVTELIETLIKNMDKVLEVEGYEEVKQSAYELYLKKRMDETHKRLIDLENFVMQENQKKEGGN